MLPRPTRLVAFAALFLGGCSGVASQTDAAGFDGGNQLGHDVGQEIGDGGAAPDSGSDAIDSGAADGGLEARDSGSVDGGFLAADSGTADTGWPLAWSDEFSSTVLDPDVWNVIDEAGGGYLDSLAYGVQCYTPANVSTSGGSLRLTTLLQASCGKSYTSGAVTTNGKFEFTRGRLEVRAQLPRSQGYWPAHWLLERGGPMEIDIMELLGSDPSQVFLTNHDWTNPATHQLDQCTATGDFAGAWHVFAAEVTDQAITWYVDGAQRCQSTRGIPGTPLYLLLNTALGGSWPGNPDGTTLFPQYHDIDWVRFYGEPSWISREQIADGSFERPGAKWMSPWYFRASAPSAATVACDTTTFADGAASARVDVTATSTAAWDVQLSQGLIWVKAGRPENISFWARASSARAVQWVVQKDSAPFTEYLNRSISLTTSWQRYTASFTPTVSEHVLFTFNLAQAAVPVWIDHVSMSY